MNGDLWQIALVDMLFLCLAVGMGLWFRAWLAGEQRRMDQRLDALEAVHARLERVRGKNGCLFQKSLRPIIVFEFKLKAT